MNECNRLADVGAYLDGELPDAEAHAMDEHIRCCPACSLEMESLRALRAAMESLHPQPMTRKRLWLALHPPWWRREVRVAWSLASAVALALLLSVSANIYLLALGTRISAEGVGPGLPMETSPRVTISVLEATPHETRYLISSDSDLRLKQAPSIQAGPSLMRSTQK
ncbi:MAG: zf-HC2 domain-containing protein [Acidobacteria bacterium]|nr:zf-HC2 domain-containing protein [Acidobacteriota bacterium]